MSKSTSVEGGEFPCGRKDCDRAFTSKPALTMHINRVHSKKIKVPKQSEEARLAKKRKYNRGYRLRKGMKVRPASLKEIKKNGTPWTSERRAKFKKTWKSKKKHSNSKHPRLTAQQIMQLEAIGYEAIIASLNTQPLEEPRVFINNCPNCGYRLQPHFLAAGFKTP